MRQQRQKRLTKKERRINRPREDVKDSRTFNITLKDIVPLTDMQSQAFNAFDNDKNVVLHGLAGTGKTFIALYLSLRDVLSGAGDYESVILVRSVVPTREMGFLPGNMKEKIKVYEAPYEKICADLFGRGDAYNTLKTKNYLDFISTSFIRGNTYDNCIIIVDEIQNMLGSEIDSIITRVGDNCKIILCGDYRQTDLQKDVEKRGIQEFFKIIRSMQSRFEFIEFGEEDIVRSGLVKDYIIAKNRLGISFQ
jgi:phosphate starvation-inducible protein PhoH